MASYKSNSETEEMDIQERVPKRKAGDDLPLREVKKGKPSERERNEGQCMTFLLWEIGGRTLTLGFQGVNR